MNVIITSKGARSARSVIVLGVVLMACSMFASAATYYVSTTGSDSNLGSASAPFRHLTRGASAATQPGDTVIVMDGTYDNEGVVAPNYVVTLYYSGTAGNPITFKAQNRGKAILDSMNTSTTTNCNGASAYFNLFRAAFIVIQGFVIQRGCDSGIQSNDTAHDITIQWNEIRNIANHTVTDQIGRDGIYLNTSEYNFTFDGNIFHDIGRTDGQSYLHFDHGIYSHGQGMTIINNQFYNMNRGWSIQLADGANNWTVANNTFAFGNANGESGHIMFWGGNYNISVVNNIFYNPNGAAMTQYAASISGSFDHNLLYGVSTIMSGGTGGLSLGTNSIGANPMFVNASSAPFNFHVQSNGAGIDAGMNLAAVSVDADGVSRQQGARTDQGAFEYVASTQAPVISGVFTTGVSLNSFTVNWSTDRPATSYVQYGPLSYTNTTPTDPSLVTMHSVTVSGLLASSLYHFRVGSTNSTGSPTLSPDYTVTTLAIASTVSLSAADSAFSVVQGISRTDGLTATLLTGSPTTVSFSAASLPSGVSASFSPSSCTATCATTLTVSTSTTTPAGVYNIVVNATGAASASATIALTITAAGPPPPTGDITTGLAARWTMKDGAGSRANDFSGNGNTATLNNPTWWYSDYGMTVWFSGSKSYGSVKDSASLKMTNQLTVSMWLRPSQNSNSDAHVISKLYDWDVKLNGNTYPQLSVAGKYATMNYSLPLITWHHVVFTFSTGVVKGYVDGVQVSLQANTFTGTETLPQYQNGLYLATDNSSGKGNIYIGSMDEVRLYNRALSASDVAALWAAKPY